MPPPSHPKRPARAAGRRPVAAKKEEPPTEEEFEPWVEDIFPTNNSLSLYENAKNNAITGTTFPLSLIDRAFKASTNKANRSKTPELQGDHWDLFAGFGPALLAAFINGGFNPAVIAGAAIGGMAYNGITRDKFNVEETTKYAQQVAADAYNQQKDLVVDIPLLGKNGYSQNAVVKAMHNALASDPKIANVTVVQRGKLLIVPTNSPNATTSRPAKRGRGRVRGI